MATKKQKQELIDVLKFTPVRATVSIQGYGGESYAGTVDRATYDFFKKNKYDLEEYAGDWDGEWSDRVPEEHQMFPPGSAYECDGLWHASGAELSNLNEITVHGDDGKEIWSHNLGFDELIKTGVTVEELSSCEIDDLDTGTVVFWGGQGEKGCFFDAELDLRAPFDPKKLTIYYENCDGWYLITGVHYNDEELDGYGGYSTSGKWSENKWIIVGDEEIYESIPIEDRVPVLEGEEMWAQEAIDNFDPAKELDNVWAEQKTEWFGGAIKPEIKGEYEVVVDAPWPNGGIGMAMWTGRAWKRDGQKVRVKEWRGLKFNPKEIQ